MRGCRLRFDGFRSAIVRVAAVVFLGAALAVVAASAEGAETPHMALNRITDTHAAELEQLAAWCDAQGLTKEAAKTRDRLKPRDPTKLYVRALPQRVGPTEPPEGASADVVAWHERFGRLRRRQAETLFSMARSAARSGRPAIAFELALRAVDEDPDNEGVRHLLGYQQYRGNWHTTYEIRKLRDGHIWSDRFGWMRRPDLKRYEEGQRLCNGRWISAEEDAKRHRDIRSGWDIETEHYTIRTNHSIEAGVALGVKLEQLYRVWQQLFVRYYATEQQVLALFDPRSRAKQIRLPRHQIVYFRDREDYHRSLADFDPNIGISVGLYVHHMHRAYFFADEDQDDRTMYHEATHQLFHESRPVARHVGLKANFWIVEGIAVYMESLRQENGYWVLGGQDDIRAKAARFRLLHDGFYVPLEVLTTYSLERVQTDEHIATLYSQMAGLTHFLVHYQEGVYRDALVAYLTAVYNGNQDPGLLARLIGVPYSELDKQYRQFMTP